jgi:hypothetical protein
MAALIDRSVQVHPFAGNLYVGFVSVPRAANRSFEGEFSATVRDTAEKILIGSKA